MVKKHPDRQTEQEASAKHQSPVSVQTTQAPADAEAAKLTGAGKKEQQKLLKENAEKGRAERHPDLPAGQHATGSFTGENERRK